MSAYDADLIVDTTPIVRWEPGTASRRWNPADDVNWLPDPRRVEVPEACTEDDLTWVNEQLVAVGLKPAVRQPPVIDITPDPRLSQVVLR